jgi:hypothetical protein
MHLATARLVSLTQSLEDQLFGYLVSGGGVLLNFGGLGLWYLWRITCPAHLCAPADDYPEGVPTASGRGGRVAIDSAMAKLRSKGIELVLCHLR